MAEDPTTPAPRRIMYFTLTDIEHAQIPMLVGYGLALVVWLGASADRNVLFGRALAFLGGLEPEEFGKQLVDVDLKIDVVPGFVACPACKSHVALPGLRGSACKGCGGRGSVPTVLRPQDRLHDEAAMLIRAEKAPTTSGLVDRNGKLLS